MALSGYIETPAYQASDGTRTLVLEWSAVQSGAGDNFSEVSWTLKGGGTSKQGIYGKNFQCQVGSGTWSDLSGDKTKLYNGTVLASGKETVYHNQDGTAEFYTKVTGFIYYYGENQRKTAEETWTLDTINRTFYTNINAYSPNGVEDYKSATFDVSYSDGESHKDQQNEPGALYKLYGTVITVSNIRPYYEYYEISSVDGAESKGNGVYQKTVTNGSDIIKIYTRYRTYTINYNANGGTGAPSSTTYTYSTNYSLSSEVPVRDGYNFLGWSIDENAEIATYVPGQRWSDYTVDNVTLYAVWIAVHEITFNGNGGIVNGNELLKLSSVKGNTISNFPTASKAHYKFIGWNTSSDGQGEYYNNLIVTENIVLYAIYQVESICYLKKNGTHKRGVAYVRRNGVYRKAIKIRR